ncbi:MAG: DUF2059 domain-containing protein [Rhodospirillaceae bacterium]|jgi:uncharacterized protein|nr:DUF2059 domain-containing protein [Rhodospirillaceae bacterium]MBT6116364.1 DUF2059 domain-containing protein [Rhodospirillaceae bacterium]
MKQWKVALGAGMIGLALMASPATAADEDEKFALAQELVGAAGMNSIAEQMTQNLIVEMTRSLKQTNPQLPEKANGIVQAVVEETAEARMGDLNGQIARLYATSFTLEELQSLVAWYGSGIGKKALQVLPIIAQQSIELGKQWAGTVGQDAANEAVKKLEAEGYELK